MDSFSVSSHAVYYLPCAVCTKPLSLPIISLTGCSHNVHKICLKELLQKEHPFCPKCERPITEWRHYPELGKVVIQLAANSFERRDLERFFLKELHTSIDQNDIDSVTLLVEQASSINVLFNGISPLYRASQKGNEAVVEVLLEKGGNPNQENDLSYSLQSIDDLHKDTPIRIAAKLGYKKLIGLFIEHKAPFDERGTDSLTPLFLAVRNGQEDTALFLIEKGANVHIRDPKDSSLILIATLFGCLKVVQELLKRGVDINQTDNRNLTPLYQAAGKDKSEVLRFLLEHGAQESINIRWLNKYTPLFNAATTGNLENVKLLIQAGADLSITYDGLTLFEHMKKQLDDGELLSNSYATHQEKTKIAGKKAVYEFLQLRM
ncbi:MAG: ankyrin repeat domain-containing protein [Chlamydiales bacterium]|nr:ankyrin repeat domain-containing protein [Chlamydiales bacterium]